jgi:secondary thiamine-phosphate synthase enzyme
MAMWQQHSICIAAKSRDFHIITQEIVEQLPALKQIKIGLLHLFIQHTSASLTINENADPTVWMDLESHFGNMVPEDAAYYMHTYGGLDDMPAHIKACLLAGIT